MSNPEILVFKFEKWINVPTLCAQDYCFTYKDILTIHIIIGSICGPKTEKDPDDQGESLLPKESPDLVKTIPKEVGISLDSWVYAPATTRWGHYVLLMYLRTSVRKLSSSFSLRNRKWDWIETWQDSLAWCIVRCKRLLGLSDINFLFDGTLLAHLDRRSMWAIAITMRPSSSSVVRRRRRRR